MNKWLAGDERTERIGGQLGFIFLGLTQLGLYMVLIYQRYVEDLPPAYYNDVGLILILSILGYWGARFFFGGYAAITFSLAGACDLHYPGGGNRHTAHLGAWMAPEWRMDWAAGTDLRWTGCASRRLPAGGLSWQQADRKTYDPIGTMNYWRRYI